MTRIAIYSRVEKHARKPERFATSDDHLVVRLELANGAIIDIEPIADRVEIREVDGRTLRIEPIGANTISIDARPHR